MIPMMVEHLARLQTGLAPDRLRALMADDVAETTGRQTIYQMIRFAQRVAEFGGAPLDPKAYKAEYNRRLLAHIAARREGLASGRTAPDSMLLPGSRAMLEALADRGLVLCLVSGTDQPDVRGEARLIPSGAPHRPERRPPPFAPRGTERKPVNTAVYGHDRQERGLPATDGICGRHRLALSSDGECRRPQCGEWGGVRAKGGEWLASAETREPAAACPSAGARLKMRPRRWASSTAM
jgi:hypothetical protein